MNMNKTQQLLELLNIQYPIFQAGMVWVSGAKLAAASANAGILGVIGAGSMKPELLEEHIQKCQSLTDKSFGINLPLLYKDVEKQIEVALNHGVKIFITSAGSPKKYTSYLKEKGAIVIHVTSHPALAKKCEDAGVDAVIVEGFEAGGHNGRDELTTLTLIPQAVQAVNIPVIAAGGIYDGKTMLAMMSLGASAVQMGSRFVMAQESSAHENFKNMIAQSGASDTSLCMKKHVPVRLLKNKFYEQVTELESQCASREQLSELLGKGRAKAGMLEGDLEAGELEIGQVSALLNDSPSVQSIISSIVTEFNSTAESLGNFKL